MRVTSLRAIAQTVANDARATPNDFDDQLRTAIDARRATGTANATRAVCARGGANHGSSTAWPWRAASGLGDDLCVTLVAWRALDAVRAASEPYMAIREGRKCGAWRVNLRVGSIGGDLRVDDAIAYWPPALCTTSTARSLG